MDAEASRSRGNMFRHEMIMGNGVTVARYGDSARYDRICGRQRSPLVAPSTPVAIKPVHTVGHIDTRLHECGTSKPIFSFKIDNGVHTILRAEG